MKCSRLKVGGISAIVCGSKRIETCIVCQEPASSLCDWKVGTGTCDAALCDKHRHQVGKNKDLCEDHFNAWQDHTANKQKDLEL